LYGYLTKPLAKDTNPNPRFALMTHVKLIPPSSTYSTTTTTTTSETKETKESIDTIDTKDTKDNIDTKQAPPPHPTYTLDVVLLLFQRGLKAGLQDNRIFRSYGLACWQKYLCGDSFDNPTQPHHPSATATLRADECLKASYEYLGRVSILSENERNPLFMITFARVCEASGEINRALRILGDMVSKFDEWEYLPHAIVYASNLCYHPCFASKLHKRGLQYMEYVTQESFDPQNMHQSETTKGKIDLAKIKQLGWTEWELYFTVGRAYQIAGRGDLAAPKFRLSLQTKQHLATLDMVTDTMLIRWLQNNETWKYMGDLYRGAGLNLFAADALAQSIHLEPVHSVGHWLPLADALRRAGAGNEAIKATAHAYEIDRCHEAVRLRLQSWSPEWRGMFQTESRHVTKIQSCMRRHLAKVHTATLRQQHHAKVFVVQGLQYWWRYYRGLQVRRAKRQRCRALFLKIQTRVRDQIFYAWSMHAERCHNVSALRHTIVMKMVAKVYREWEAYAKYAAERRRIDRARQVAQEQKVNKVLMKILRRMETKVFYQWSVYAQRSIGIKHMMRRMLLEKKKFIKDRWYTNVIDAIEERRMKLEPTVFVRDDDLTRRLYHADVLHKKTVATKFPPRLHPYVIGVGESWKRKTSRLNTVASCLYRAHKIGDTVQIPHGVPFTERELSDFMAFHSVVSTAAPMTASDGRTLAEYLIGNQSVRSLLLYNGQLQDKGVMAIAATIELTTPEVHNVVLQTLGIGNHNVGPRGAVALGKALVAKHCTLTCLYLENNPRIGNEGVAMLAEALSRNVRLEKLVLSGNNVSDPGCLALAHSLKKNATLRRLTLNHNNIGGKGFAGLLTIMSNGRNTTLSHLSMHHNTRVGDEGMAHLSKCIGASLSHVVDLDFSSCGINDHGAQTLAKGFSGYYNKGRAGSSGDNAHTALLLLQRLSVCGNAIHGSAAKTLTEAVGKVTEGCAIELEGNPIDPTTKGALVFETFNKRIGSPRRKTSPRKGGGGGDNSMFVSSQQLSHLTAPEAPSLKRGRGGNNQFLPSRAAMESLGRVGLDRIKDEQLKSPPRTRTEEDEEGEEVLSFSPAGFQGVVLPPPKKNLLMRGKRNKGGGRKYY